MNAKIRALISEFGRLSVDVATLKNEADLYTAGLTSFASVQLMLGIEDAFDIEFPERMLNRRSFASIAAIEQAVSELLAEAGRDAEAA
ncbi:MAG: acyl carrier protein [Beijerinckiaceae bacterium]|nr:acyl carrier protein [Beijerinckiaceae bacterium]